MPRIAVDHCRRDLVDAVSHALDLATRAPNLFFLNAAGVHEPVGVRRVEDVAGLAMLKLQLAWESFLEAAFARYMCGARTASGFQPTLLANREATIGAALQQLIGSQRYISWSSGSTQGRAHVYFDRGEPFATAVGLVQTTLDEMNVVRNRLAHRSGYAVVEFRRVVRARLGYVPKGMTAGRFLLTVQPGAAPGQRIIDDYGLKLLAASTVIVP